jgi:SAM-dependent methyltransferase
MKHLDLIVCPKDKCKVVETVSGLVSSCGISFKVFNKKPILIVNPKAISLSAPAAAQISDNGPFEIPISLEDSPEARILHLGAGNVKSDDPRVISTDLLPNENVDYVCEAEYLPFADETFDYVASGAVLEHVYNPIAVAAEMRRVLKVGGTIQSTVAFNQPYHGFPSHYFNWSPIAMETYLLSEFELVKSGVAQDGTLAVTLTQSWDLFLEQLTENRREFLLDSSLREALGFFRSDRSLENPNLSGVPRFALEQLSSAYEVIGIKRHSLSHIDPKTIQSIWEQRRMNLLRIQEITFYSLKLFEKSGETFDSIDYQIPENKGFSTDFEAMEYLKLLERDEDHLREFRDKVITRFLQSH